MTPDQERKLNLIYMASFCLLAVGIFCLVPPGMYIYSNINTNWIEPKMTELLLDGAIITTLGVGTLFSSLFVVKE